MNITQESTGELTATIKIELVPDDYREQVGKALKEIQQKSTLKGFRPGKVPHGLIKKMYGKPALAEEINKIISDSLNHYIVDNKLDILGYPITNPDKNKEVDFKDDINYEFFFDIGLAPTFDVEISDKTEVDYADIMVEDKIVDSYVEETRKRFGKPITVDSIKEGDLLKGEVTQLDAEGNILEEGVKHMTSLGVNFIKDEDVKKSFIGKSNGEKVIFNPLKATENETETAAMLGISKDEVEKLEADYEFTISEISRVEPAAINKDLFSKVYPNDAIEDEAAFREKLRSEAKGYYQNESDNFFVHNAMDKLIDETVVHLPDDFVKRWLVESDEKITPESVERDYDKYQRSLKHQLIINKISKDHDVKVDEQEIRNFIKGYFTGQYGFDTSDEDRSKQLDGIVDSMLSNKKEVNRIYDQLFDKKLRELLLSKLKLNKKEITYEDFIKEANEHTHSHHNTHDHEH
ncbi:MAG: trigger factor [Bacteroidales bacterium]